MENLTKQQLTLLALLLSFVTSIATGIVTVSLMERAPKGVTQTINRVIEHTVERVVPAENQKAAMVTKETVVVRSDDLVVAAIEKNAQTLVRVKRVEGSGDRRNETFVGLGAIISKEGLVAVDASVLGQRLDEYGTPIPRSFLGKFPDGTLAQLQVVGVDDESGIGLFSTVRSADAKSTLSPVVWGNSDALKLGQTVVSLGGEADNAVATGIVANLAFKESPDKTVTAIYTDREAASAVSGAMLLNLSGELVGMSVHSGGTERIRYTPANLIKAGIEKVKSDAQ